MLSECIKGACVDITLFVLKKTACMQSDCVQTVFYIYLFHDLDRCAIAVLKDVHALANTVCAYTAECIDSLDGLL